jgi:hypothetical protein
MEVSGEALKGFIANLRKAPQLYAAQSAAIKPGAAFTGHKNNRFQVPRDIHVCLHHHGADQCLMLFADGEAVLVMPMQTLNAWGYSSDVFFSQVERSSTNGLPTTTKSASRVEGEGFAEFVRQHFVSLAPRKVEPGEERPEWDALGDATVRLSKLQRALAGWRGRVQDASRRRETLILHRQQFERILEASPRKKEKLERRLEVAEKSLLRDKAPDAMAEISGTVERLERSLMALAIQKQHALDELEAIDAEFARLDGMVIERPAELDLLMAS